jgi:hypothetical protein
MISTKATSKKNELMQIDQQQNDNVSITGTVP